MTLFDLRSAISHFPAVKAIRWSWLAIWLAALLCISLLNVRIPTAGGSLPVAVEGVFVRDGQFSPMPGAKFPPARLWNSFAGDERNQGILRLGPFTADDSLTVLAGGYPGLPGNALYLERVDTGEKLPLSSGYIGQRWDLIQVRLPSAWRRHQVTIVAVDRDRDPGGWLAVSEPLRAIGPRFLTGSFATTILAWLFEGLLLVPIYLVVLSRVRRQAWIPPHWAALVSGSLVGLCGYVVFWAYFAQPLAGRILSDIIILVSAARCFWRESNSPLSTPWVYRTETSSVLILAVTIGFFYLSILFLFPPARTGETLYDLAANRFIPELPGDNCIPHGFAEGMTKGPCPIGLGAGWLSSDRPPLQSGWLLLTWHAASILGIDSVNASASSSIWLQLFWVAAAYGLLRALGLSPISASATTAALAFTGFFLLHTVFTWPKLISGALACGAWALMVLDRSSDETIRLRRNALSGLLFALSWLAHGGVAFAFIATIPWILIDLRQRPWKPLIAAGLLAIVLATPWVAFQKYYAPPGNRLLKWHLGGQIEIDQRSTWTTIRENYHLLGWKKAWENKRSNLQMLIAGDWLSMGTPGSLPIKVLRQQEFYFLWRGTNFWLIGLLALAGISWSQNRDSGLRALKTLGLWISATLAVWVLLLFNRNNASVHQGSFTVPIGILCLLVFGLRLAGKPWFILVFLVQAASFVRVWFGPNDALGGSMDPMAMAGVMVSAAVLLVMIGRDLWSRSREIA